MQINTNTAVLNDPECYAGGNVATTKVPHDSQVKGDNPEKKECPGSPGCRLGVGLTPHPIKNMFCWEAFKIENRMETIKKTQHEQGLMSGTWNMLSLYTSSAPQNLIQVTQH